MAMCPGLASLLMTWIDPIWLQWDSKFYGQIFEKYNLVTLSDLFSINRTILDLIPEDEEQMEQNKSRNVSFADHIFIQ